MNVARLYRFLRVNIGRISRANFFLAGALTLSLVMGRPCFADVVRVVDLQGFTRAASRVSNADVTIYSRSKLSPESIELVHEDGTVDGIRAAAVDEFTLRFVGVPSGTWRIYSPNAESIEKLSRVSIHPHGSGSDESS